MSRFVDWIRDNTTFQGCLTRKEMARRLSLWSDLRTIFMRRVPAKPRWLRKNRPKKHVIAEGHNWVLVDPRRKRFRTRPREPLIRYMTRNKVNV